MRVDKSEGIICPWCVGDKPIHICPHNPFVLMQEVTKLQNIVNRGDDAVKILQDLKRYFDND